MQPDKCGTKARFVSWPENGILDTNNSVIHQKNCTFLFFFTRNMDHMPGTGPYVIFSTRQKRGNSIFFLLICRFLYHSYCLNQGQILFEFSLYHSYGFSISLSTSLCPVKAGLSSLEFREDFQSRRTYL